MSVQVYVEFVGDASAVERAVRGNGGFLPGTVNVRVTDYRRHGGGYVLTLEAPDQSAEQIVAAAQRVARYYSGSAAIGGVRIQNVVRHFTGGTDSESTPAPAEGNDTGEQGTIIGLLTEIRDMLRDRL